MKTNTTDTKGVKYWAIGLGEWVEIRKGSTRPETIKTQLAFSKKTRVTDWGTGKRKTVTQKREVPIYEHKGGTVLGVFTLLDYSNAHPSALYLTRGMVRQITKEVITKLGLG